jgi:hypothetical protein
MQTLVEPGSVAGPSGTTRTELPQSSQSSQDENEEEVTESEEEADSEEDTRWRRGARTRGRVSTFEGEQIAFDLKAFKCFVIIPFTQNEDKILLFQSNVRGNSCTMHSH